jgi:hypothetical protein
LFEIVKNLIVAWSSEHQALFITDIEDFNLKIAKLFVLVSDSVHSELAHGARRPLITELHHTVHNFGTNLAELIAEVSPLTLNLFFDDCALSSMTCVTLLLFGIQITRPVMYLSNYLDRAVTDDVILGYKENQARVIVSGFFPMLH